MIGLGLQVCTDVIFLSLIKPSHTLNCETEAPREPVVHKVQAGEVCGGAAEGPLLLQVEAKAVDQSMLNKNTSATWTYSY